MRGLRTGEWRVPATMHEAQTGKRLLARVTQDKGRRNKLSRPQRIPMPWEDDCVHQRSQVTTTSGSPQLAGEEEGEGAVLGNNSEKTRQKQPERNIPKLREALTRVVPGRVLPFSLPIFLAPPELLSRNGCRPAGEGRRSLVASRVGGRDGPAHVRHGRVGGGVAGFLALMMH